MEDTWAIPSEPALLPSASLEQEYPPWRSGSCCRRNRSSESSSTKPCALHRSRPEVHAPNRYSTWPTMDRLQIIYLNDAAPSNFAGTKIRHHAPVAAARPAKRSGKPAGSAECSRKRRSHVTIVTPSVNMARHSIHAHHGLSASAAGRAVPREDRAPGLSRYTTTASPIRKCGRREGSSETRFRS